MNDKIQHIIQEIRTKHSAVVESMLHEKQKVSQLEQEVLDLKTALFNTENQLQELKSENLNLQSLLEEAKTQVVEQENAQSIAIDDAYIDEMVREIEYCIGQLKNNA